MNRGRHMGTLYFLKDGRISLIYSRAILERYPDGDLEAGEIAQWTIEGYNLKIQGGSLEGIYRFTHLNKSIAATEDPRFGYTFRLNRPLKNRYLTGDTIEKTFLMTPYETPKVIMK